MEMLGVACEVQASGAEEVVSSSEPEKVVEELSRLKCLDVAEVTEGDSVVIGADTVVAFEGEILGKPKGSTHAREMMKRLQGKVHQVYTGVTIAVKAGNAKRVVTFCDCTDVEFYPMTEGEIAETMGIKNVALCLPQPAAGFSPSVSFADSSLVRGNLESCLF